MQNIPPLFRKKEVSEMSTGSNRKLIIGIGIGVTFAVIVESAVAYGFVGATASMGALGLIALSGLVVYVSVKMLMRSYERRKIKMLLHKSAYAESSGDGYLQCAGDNRSPKEKPISEKDKKLIVGHIDEIMRELSNRQSDKSVTVAKLITDKDKKTIMEHIDELLVSGPEYGGERSS
jgi:hypothetical protein